MRTRATRIPELPRCHQMVDAAPHPFPDNGKDQTAPDGFIRAPRDPLRRRPDRRLGFAVRC